ncbi:O-antigen ligase family protein [Aureitalea marina]|uniref:O-antigen ligase-related domain-containing protein n=1 Tax=Aureitalea marina TaxID=930804 RepID=A0A2S7KNP2_9FLAO|nr:O-antigen ligase family protein [Aureitalea marina]PQB04242.1 hypothetical protein BST85_04480 [Aureitalea marina]
MSSSKKILVSVALFLAPIAVVMTYSRGAILALILVVVGVLIFQKARVRYNFAVPLIGAILLFQLLGWNSEYFFFERIENRVTASIENPYEDVRETERILAYIEPFEHLAQNPINLFIGQGFARSKILNGDLRSVYSENAADHAVFAKAYYAYGMITAIMLIILFIKMALYTYRMIYGFTNQKYYSNQFSRILIAILMGFSSWFVFGHAAVSTPRGSMLMFFVFGLVITQYRLISFEFEEEQKRQSDS